MTFISELARLREAATKDPNIGTYSELRKFLGNHAEAIEELVRAAEQLRRWDGKNPSSGIYEDFCQALESLNRSE